jgi:hypothetical protein
MITITTSSILYILSLMLEIEILSTKHFINECNKYERDLRLHVEDAPRENL